MSYREAALLVTTHCNRRCPDCCYQIPTHATLAAEHYDWDYFARAATFLGGQITKADENGFLQLAFVVLKLLDQKNLMVAQIQMVIKL